MKPLLWQQRASRRSSSCTASLVRKGLRAVSALQSAVRLHPGVRGGICCPLWARRWWWWRWARWWWWLGRCAQWHGGGAHSGSR
jgi:hypothetical protein